MRCSPVRRKIGRRLTRRRAAGEMPISEPEGPIGAAHRGRAFELPVLSGICIAERSRPHVALASPRPSPGPALGCKPRGLPPPRLRRAADHGLRGAGPRHPQLRTPPTGRRRAPGGQQGAAGGTSGAGAPEDERSGDGGPPHGGGAGDGDRSNRRAGGLPRLHRRDQRPHARMLCSLLPAVAVGELRRRLSGELRGDADRVDRLSRSARIPGLAADPPERDRPHRGRRRSRVGADHRRDHHRLRRPQRALGRERHRLSRAGWRALATRPAHGRHLLRDRQRGAAAERDRATAGVSRPRRDGGLSG